METRNGVAEIDRAEIVDMGETVVRMLRSVKDAFTHLETDPLDRAARDGRMVHLQERALLERAAKRHAVGSERGVDDLVFVPMHLDRIADNIELLAGATGRMIREGLLFTDRAVREIQGLFDVALELLEGLRDSLRTGNKTLLRFVLQEGRVCAARANEYALFHEQRLIEGVCLPRASSVYLSMLDQLLGIEWHARQIADKLQPAPIAPAGGGRKDMRA